jgi:hypothetical protein
MELRSDIERTDCAMKIPFVRDFQIKNKVNAIQELDNQSTVVFASNVLLQNRIVSVCVGGGLLPHPQPVP